MVEASVDEQSAPRKSFFDLPLELREQIYENVLPSDRKFSIVRHHYTPEEKDICCLFRTSRRISKEARQIVKRVCGARIILSPFCDVSNLLSIKNLERAKSIEIFIDYKKHVPANTKIGGLEHLIANRNEGTLIGINNSTEKLGQILMHYPHLPPLRLRFRDEADACYSKSGRCSDPFWTGKVYSLCQSCPLGTHKGLGVVLLKTRPCFSESWIESVLWSFRKLTNFESASIIPLKGIENRNQFGCRRDLWMNNEYSDRPKTYEMNGWYLYDAEYLEPILKQVEIHLSGGCDCRTVYGEVCWA